MNKTSQIRTGVRINNAIMSSVTYFLLTDFLDLIASIKKKTFISFKIKTIKFGT